MLARRLQLLAASAGALIIVLAVGIYLASSRVDYDLHRSEIARQELESYLKLSEVVYRHFRLEANVLLGNDPEAGTEASLKKLKETIEHLKALTKRETIFVGDEDKAQELEEFDRIAALETAIHNGFREIERIEQHFERGDEGEARRLLSAFLKNEIDGTIENAIAAAIEDEAKEVLETDEEAHAILANISYVAEITATAALVMTTLMFFVFTKRIGRPIGRLVEGLKQVAGGDLSHRLAGDSRGALADVANHFNMMVGKLEKREAELRSARAQLEIKVQKRTRELDAANKALQRTDQLRQHFLSDISHELRTPITVVQGEAEVTLRGRDKEVEDYKRALQHIKDCANQLGGLVNDLLFMARTSAGAIYLSIHPVRLTNLLETVRKDAEFLGSSKSVNITFRRVDSAATVLGDHQRLRQLFIILIENAIRYSGSEVSIVLDITRSDGWIRTRICDNGSGMSATELDNAFDRFYRGMGAKQSFSEGSGLGLPLAKSIVEAHRGKISIESNPGRGTTVTIDLPPAQEIRPAA